MAAELRFRAMGSDAHVIVVGRAAGAAGAAGAGGAGGAGARGGPGGLASLARRRIDELEAKWSRFVDTSEVSRLNRAAGTAVEVSPDTVRLVRSAVDAWRMSAGSFDPTVLEAMVQAGYDRSFELLVPPAGGGLIGSSPAVALPGSAAGGGWAGRSPVPGTHRLMAGVTDIVVDGSTVCLPVATGFDPGGIGKGLAADMVCEELMAAGAAGVCVNLGGDVRVCGAGPEGRGWTVAVEHPSSVTPVGLLGIADGAVATTTTLRRRWVSGGVARHHVIDPYTGVPSDTDLTHATVIAAKGWEAEVLAKAVLLAGSAHPFDILGGTGAEGIAVGADGRVQASEGVGAFLGAGVLLRTVAA